MNNNKKNTQEYNPAPNLSPSISHISIINEKN